MELASILAPSAVKVLSTVSSKKRLFQDLGDIAADCYGINAEDAFAALSERENLGPTGVGRGVALPHARLAGVTEVTGCFVRVERPFDFDAVDRQPVDLIFALFAPEDSGVDHLKALALVSRSMRDASICAKLRANTDTAALHALLTDSLSNKAA
ncbi:PTS sugar transporter subunit IIA [Aliiroseovarius sp. S1123]|jgi:PTS system nitrogen regulatory IIA component|uniref:PTS sugar transporter subunit IIA n=1 Tax=unclassified Aliiroseovarius TaxID=2623558 RepID=UPI001FF142DC|nr:PTS sugar transporter subunit IIA [Aliiroseovarius sp. S1123]MCK0171090.1 PTS sugar transporter subunit IIA [Aliiroseovarius sp. S1123]